MDVSGRVRALGTQNNPNIPRTSFIPPQTPRVTGLYEVYFAPFEEALKEGHGFFVIRRDAELFPKILAEVSDGNTTGLVHLDLCQILNMKNGPDLVIEYLREWEKAPERKRKYPGPHEDLSPESEQLGSLIT